MSHARSAAIAPLIDRWVPAVVFAALPTLGLAAGPSYAALVFGLAAMQLLGDLAIGRGIPAIDRPLAPGLSYSYRFKRAYLARWREVSAGVDQLIVKFRQR